VFRLECRTESHQKSVWLFESFNNTGSRSVLFWDDQIFWRDPQRVTVVKEPDVHDLTLNGVIISDAGIYRCFTEDDGQSPRQMIACIELLVEGDVIVVS